MMKHRISFLLAVILATVLCLSGYAYAEQNDTTLFFLMTPSRKQLKWQNNLLWNMKPQA